MKKIVSLLLTLSILVLCVSALSSCGAPKDDGAEISVYLGERIYDFDPTDYYVDSNAESVMSLLFEPLFRLNANGKDEKAYRHFTRAIKKVGDRADYIKSKSDEIFGK